jgi:thiol-disulfide isomerase/thioredoxin
MKHPLLNFPKPANQYKKCGTPQFFRIGVILLILLMLVKMLGLDDFRPEIFRKHDVAHFSNPIKLPDDYMVADLSGNSVALNDLLGEDVTILAFWATWCGYCASEFPEMDGLANYLANHGVKILPIARGDDTPEKINRFFERGNIKNMETVIASTPSLYKHLGVMGYPTFIAVDKNGMAFAKLRPKWEANDIFELFEKLARKE